MKKSILLLATLLQFSCVPFFESIVYDFKNTDWKEPADFEPFLPDYIWDDEQETFVVNPDSVYVYECEKCK